MFKKILIANRGEIAVRIIRACREMGIETVAVYSEIDKESLHVEMADEAICIGPPSPKDSYLNIKNILSATVLTGAEAIHPGFGFLSENSKFASMCKECNIVFIGPDSELIDKMGNKSNARRIMEEAGVAVVPGSKKPIENSQEALDLAEKIGYPVMIKASAGGGGRGIRVVKHEKELIEAINTAKKEALSAFGDDSMYMEKYIECPKHVEIQILGDNYGNIVYLGERDCSIQRRNQKILEEAPCSVITQELRNKMGEAAVRAAKYVGYKNAGTIEFLLDKHNNFYFMEMNTRIQVEHPITEFITGVDLIKEQIKIAAGMKLSFSQEDIKIQGHSIECRINAEDTLNNFMPCPGRISGLFIPGGLGIRVDSNIYDGYTIPPTYDSMIAKLIVHGRDRHEAINKMKRALGEFLIDGIKTNIDYHMSILNNEKFISGNYDTGFIGRDHK
ncbi:acetyl-CoA carboxylase biotin carboxylase subunit [Clostridium cochlearium]|jgi:acetyl-CoA carboxylase biotin carboxylase subunit|uniref:Biotin carboxylase n=1 Tax=Clostridium cochlearium TaxID=1494 RepID=A0ABY0QK89_CLOCO|nr:acetyl-CoA carboxylase biotin carboxylase subunit [Clostridium cochlearium]MBE6065608.1 acetyl-CoA carboxylase biotin carboxylase subunit [Clostridium cochlearium]MBU5270239.1 acetyl-CoA carboxylase biotin carboxylase subunit [Clostridium cochlearium]MCR1972071.1 acetyl-CoA carboxylase biotin carboxylase subunit [Clostridium cochlearium]NMA57136.1 acetyl-CoA carboxylase biotin carboxylase subunit [Clostridium cochlearium]NME95147.1 acetyl-CoA carboxylase biotin carboxylase subunit [Clostrid